MERNQIIGICGTDYEAMTKRLLEAADLAGIIGERTQRIALKPNLVVAKPASSGATTHPQIVAGTLDYLAAHGFENVRVMEGSWVGDKTGPAAEISGIAAVCRARGVPFCDLQKEPGVPAEAGGMKIALCRSLTETDFLVNLPVLKGHCQTVMTCALKNHKGVITNAEKRRFHALGLQKPIACLSALMPREFILADNICGDLDFEEGGNPVRMDRLFCCLDPVLCDAYACSVMGLRTEDVPYIGMAEKLGSGSADLARAQILSLGGEAPARTAPAGRAAALAKFVSPREACSACYGSLIYALSRLGAAGRLPENAPKICIGQGWRGEAGGIGVGACTGKCGKSLAGCPPTGAEMVRFLAENWKGGGRD